MFAGIFVVVFFFKQGKQKLALIAFQTIHNYSKLLLEGQGTAILMGLVSHECMWVGAGRLSLLQKRILIFNL